MKKLSRVVLAALTLALMTAATSEATVVRVGATTAAIVAATRGNAVAYDSINHVYLVVSSAGALFGRWVDRNGNPIGAPFTIQANPALFAAFPRATFSPDANGGAGGFLVNWVESDSATAAILHGRMVAFGQGGPYGADNVLSPDGAWWEEATYGAYSTGSHEFLLVYRTNGSYVLRGVRTDVNAAPLAPPFTISQTNQFENNPSVAYNPVTNQFLACWTMFTAASTGLLDCQLVQSGSGALVGGPILVQATGSVWFTDTTYNRNTNQFLVTWDETHGSATLARLVNADGSLPGGVIAVTRSYAGYDGTATAYNPITRSFFVIAYDLVGDQTQDGGVELTDAGQPVDSGLQVTSLCVAGVKCGSFYPQIAASTEDPNWLVTTATSFVQASTQMIAGQASGGAPTPPNTPAPPQARPMLAVDAPANNAVVPSNFAVQGWAADAGAPSGTGVDVVVVWAWPATGGSAILAGIANYGASRPDVGSYLGAQFAATGYNVITTLPAGGYTLSIYAHSTVNGSWNSPVNRVVTVQAPASRPMMWVDSPAVNQNTSQFLHAAGWAVDLGSTNGPGVDAVHVWAYPASNPTQPIFLGAATMGVSRPDLGAWLGPNFGASGYYLDTTIAPGSYTLVFYAHSSLTGTFNNTQVVPITVR